jgi:hypothetical protein
MRRAGQARPGEALLWLMPADIGYILAGDDYHFCSREDQISNCWVGKDVCMYVPMVQMLIHTLKQNEDQAYIQGTDVRVLGGE